MLDFIMSGEMSELERQDRIHCTIEGVGFTLFYDYDELRDRKLYAISELGRIEWLRKRMNVVFLEPLCRIFNLESKAYKELCSHDEEYEPVRTAMIIAFSALLNGMEALGSFLKEKSSKKKSSINKDRFFEFMKLMPAIWKNIQVPLWKNYRNGVAHQFVIKGGGLEFSKDGTLPFWYDDFDGRLILRVDPVLFFRDFLCAVDKFFLKVNSDSETRKIFLKGFEDAYPKYYGSTNRDNKYKP